MNNLKKKMIKNLYIINHNRESFSHFIQLKNNNVYKIRYTFVVLIDYICR